MGVKCQVLDVDPEVQKIPQTLGTMRNWGYCFFSLLLRKFRFPWERDPCGTSGKKSTC